jgi:hypothetical protein
MADAIPIPTYTPPTTPTASTAAPVMPYGDNRRYAVAPTQVYGPYGYAAEGQGLKNLYAMLLAQGRVDPRLLAQAQAQNARSTQQQQDLFRGQSAARGIGGGGFSQALLASMGAAGINRSSALNYQDIADSYKRNQENLGLMNQLVTQPQLGYATLRQQETESLRAEKTKRQAAKLALFGSLISAAGSAAGGGR